MRQASDPTEFGTDLPAAKPVFEAAPAEPADSLLQAESEGPPGSGPDCRAVRTRRRHLSPREADTQRTSGSAEMQTPIDWSPASRRLDNLIMTGHRTAPAHAHHTQESDGGNSARLERSSVARFRKFRLRMCVSKDSILLWFEVTQRVSFRQVMTPQVGGVHPIANGLTEMLRRCERTIIHFRGFDDAARRPTRSETHFRPVIVTATVRYIQV